MNRRILFLSVAFFVAQSIWANDDSSVDYVVAVLQVIAIVAIITSIVYGTLKFFREIRRAKEREWNNYKRSFEELVSQLNSEKTSAQLSASILLRRYFKDTAEDNKKELRQEAIDVISSLLRILPTGVLQKTLADGLGYATDLSECDLQKTNLQDVLLDNKKQEILMNKTDLFLADLSFANLEGIKGHGIIFYNANLFYSRIRNCDFTNANFRGADLNGIVLKDCILKGANFSGARNIPIFIEENLDEERKFRLNGMISAKHDTKDKTIFFSMPGLLNKEDEMITKNYKEFLEKNGYEVIYYKRDEYPRFGQLNRVKESINHSSGMIAFGFKQIYISSGEYRPQTQEESTWKDKWLSTPWNEIEVGIGLAVGMPILLVHDPIINDGVFDDGLSECFVARIASTEDSRRLEYNKSFQEWFSKL
jgi:uncharacterized protein YjbI with pentapeptide repeats